MTSMNKAWWDEVHPISCISVIQGFPFQAKALFYDANFTHLPKKSQFIVQDAVLSIQSQICSDNSSFSTLERVVICISPSIGEPKKLSSPKADKIFYFVGSSRFSNVSLVYWQFVTNSHVRQFSLVSSCAPRPGLAVILKLCRLLFAEYSAPILLFRLFKLIKKTVN